MGRGNGGMSDRVKVSDAEALRFHAEGRPGKLAIVPTKPLDTARDLSLAYSPGVAAPCLEIHRDPALAFDYTARGNVVAIVSNGSAVLGLGNLGALGAKPVMEGKAVLFKRFADIDGVDIEIDSEDVDEIVDTVRLISPTFGGVNLEDIKAPECFVVEQRLRDLVDIPIFHDDQHGTAIICLAGVINALEIAGKDLGDCKVVVNGAGAAGIACLELVKARGLPHDNAVLCDSRGVVHRGRERGVNQWKSAHAIDTKARTLAEAMDGADIFLGVSVKDAVSPDMVASMADRPIVFAMANPDPEIAPEDARAARADAIVATGRSDYPNQVNNVPRVPLHLPRRARRAGHDDQRRHEDRRGRGDRRAGARGRARRGGLRLRRRVPPVRPRLHHSQAVRSPADRPRAGGRRQGGHGLRRGAPADRRHGRLPRAAFGAAVPGRGPHVRGLRGGARAAGAGGVRRGGRRRKPFAPRRCGAIRASAGPSSSGARTASSNAWTPWA